MEKCTLSEVASLVLGFLRERKCFESWQTFLLESPDLEEYRFQCIAGKYPTTDIDGKSLLQILNECFIVKARETLEKGDAQVKIEESSESSSERGGSTSEIKPRETLEKGDAQVKIEESSESSSERGGSTSEIKPRETLENDDAQVKLDESSESSSQRDGSTSEIKPRETLKKDDGQLKIEESSESPSERVGSTSEIDLGYLRDPRCREALMKFSVGSPYLEEHLRVCKVRKPPAATTTTNRGKSLLEILEKNSALKARVILQKDKAEHRSAEASISSNESALMDQVIKKENE